MLQKSISDIFLILIYKINNFLEFQKNKHLFVKVESYSITITWCLSVMPQ